MNSPYDELLERHIDRQRAGSDPQFCADEPDLCNLCAARLDGHRFLVDGEVKGSPQMAVPNGETMGQWAYMCARCFASRGVGVRWGVGQLYERTPRNEWQLVGGFPPETTDD